MFAQELADPDRDRLGFIPWAIEAQEEVVSVSDVSQPPVSLVEFLPRRDDPQSLPQGLDRLRGGPLRLQTLNPAEDPLIFRIAPLPLPPRVLGDERPLDELVQPVEVDIREQWAGDPPLRRTAQGGSIVPLFEVSGLEQVLDQDQEAVVAELLAKDRQQDRMIDIVKT